jgi:hypothetical protein
MNLENKVAIADVLNLIGTFKKHGCADVREWDVVQNMKKVLKLRS